MATYPGGVYAPPTRVNATDDVVANDFNLPGAEIVAIQTELGTNPKGSYADVKARIVRAETIGADIYRNATSSASSGSGSRTLAAYDTTRRADSGFTVTLGSGTIAVPSDGYYVCEGHVKLSVSATDSCLLSINDGTNDLIRGMQTNTSTSDIAVSGVTPWITAGTVLRVNVFTGATQAFIGDSTGSRYYFRVVRL